MRRVAIKKSLKNNGKPPFVYTPVPHESIVTPKKETIAMTYLLPEEIEGGHRGKTIFVLGNGPSLRDAIKYKKELENNICISVYVSYWLIKCQYVLFADLCKVPSDVYEELLSLDSHIFTVGRKDVSEWFNKYKQRVASDGILSEKYEDGLYNGGNSLFLAINLAYIMKAKKIVLLGCDMNNGKHFYDGMPKFYDNAFYKYTKPFNKKRNPPGQSAYRGSEYVVKSLNKTNEFLKKKKVSLINCSTESILGGNFKPLGDVISEIN